MLKKLAMTSAIALVMAAPAWAQTSRSTTTGTTMPSATTSSQIDAHKLIGRSVQNADNSTIGKIDSVILDPSGKVQQVVLGVGGFLGVGEKDVAVNWSQLKVSNNGEKVVMDTTKDNLKALPAYNWPANHTRGSIWSADSSDRSGVTSSGTTGTTGSSAGTGTRPGGTTGR